MTQNLRNVQAGRKIWFLIKKKTCIVVRHCVAMLQCCVAVLTYMPLSQERKILEMKDVCADGFSGFLSLKKRQGRLEKLYLSAFLRLSGSLSVFIQARLSVCLSVCLSISLSLPGGLIADHAECFAKFDHEFVWFRLFWKRDEESSNEIHGSDQCILTFPWQPCL